MFLTVVQINGINVLCQMLLMKIQFLLTVQKMMKPKTINKKIKKDLMFIMMVIKIMTMIIIKNKLKQIK